MDRLKEKKFISAVVYVHNQEGNIADFIKNLIELLENHFEHSEIVCVNDFSTDGSVDEIKSVKEFATETAISIINLSSYHGLETAMNAGVDLSIGDFILEIDTTNQDWNDDDVIAVYRKMLEGYDIVGASTNKPQKLSSSLFYWIYEKFSNNGNRMYTENFRILSRRAYNRISGMNKTIPYRKGIYTNCGLKTINVKYDQKKKINENVDKLQRKYRRNLAFETLILFTDVGYVLTKFMTLLMMFISLFMVFYTIACYLMINPVAGWTTTVLFLSVAFFGLFAILTIVVQYLQILVDLNFRRSKYSFESIEKLTK